MKEELKSAHALKHDHSVYFSIGKKRNKMSRRAVLRKFDDVFECP